MSCGCENRKLGREIDRVRRLAKGFAEVEETTVAIYQNGDGTYGFRSIDREINETIIEYITPY